MARPPTAPANVPGKPVIARYASPNLNDRIFKVRKDTRLPNYQIPDKGAAFDGPRPGRLATFKFATAVPSPDMPEWEDWYYLNERANQDAYNYEVTYPGGNKTIAQITRTYVFLREDYTEIADNSPDPIYTGTVLVDRKIIRSDDPVIDALFIVVQRVFEKLPGVALVDKRIGAPNLIPEKYRRLITDIETKQPVPAGYTFPSGLTGDEAEIELAQESITKARLRVLEQVIAVGDPMVGNKFDTWGDLTILESIVNEGDPNDEGYLVKDSSVTPLGNGKSIKITVLYPAGLAGVLLLSKTLGQDNLIPEKYRGLVRHDIANSIVDPDTYSFPSILTGDQSQVEYVEETIHQARLKIVEEIINVGNSLVGSELDRWGTLIIEESLVNEGDPIDTGFLVLKSSVTPLGNGKAIKITVQYPSDLGSVYLRGQELDNTFNVVIPYREQLRTAGSGIGVGGTQVEPVNRDRELQKIADTSTLITVLGNYLLTFPGVTNLQLPDVLDSIATEIESRSGEGSFSETGAGSVTGSGSASLDIRGSGNSSASIMPVVIAQISQPWGHNVPTTRYMFFLPMPLTAADVLTKLATILSPREINPWPKFQPTGATIIAIGEALTLSCEASSKWSAGLSSGGGSSGAESVGTGSSRRFELTINTIRIPPTLHRAIGNAGGNLIEGTVDISCEATAQASFDTLAHIEESGSVSGRAYGSIAATNPESIPTEGLYLLDTKVEPYRYGFAMVHCEVVDFADVTTGISPPIVVPPGTATPEVWGRLRFSLQGNDAHARLFVFRDAVLDLNLYLRPPKTGDPYWRYGVGTTFDTSRIDTRGINVGHQYLVDILFRYDSDTDQTTFACALDGINIEGGAGSLIIDGHFVPSEFSYGAISSIAQGSKINNRSLSTIMLGTTQGGSDLFNGAISGGILVPPFDSATAGITGSGTTAVVSSSSGTDSYVAVAVTLP